MDRIKEYSQKVFGPIDVEVLQAINEVAKKNVGYLNIVKTLVACFEAKGIKTKESVLSLKPKEFVQSITKYSDGDGNNKYIYGAPSPFRKDEKKTFEDFLKDVQKELRKKEIKPEEAKPKSEMNQKDGIKNLGIYAKDIIESVKSGRALSEETIYLLQDIKEVNNKKIYNLYISLPENCPDELNREVFDIYQKIYNKNKSTLDLFENGNKEKPSLEVRNNSYIFNSSSEDDCKEFNNKLTKLINKPSKYFLQKLNYDIEKFEAEEVQDKITSLSGINIHQITKVKEAEKGIVKG